MVGFPQRSARQRSVRHRRPNAVPVYTSTKVQFDLRDPIQPLVPKQAPRKHVLISGSLKSATEEETKLLRQASMCFPY